MSYVVLTLLITNSKHSGKILEICLYLWFKIVKVSFIILVTALFTELTFQVLCADEVAIIDEIQMVRDVQRGWAWTRALLGIVADEIHLCGEEGAVDLVKSVISTTGEDVEVTVVSN